MCTPVLIGVASFASSAVGSIAQHQQQRAQVAYSNAAAQQQAQYQNLANQQQVDYQNAVARQQTELQNALATQQANFQNQIAQQEFQLQQQAFQQSEAAFQQQLQLNAEAANRGYVAEQEKLLFEQRKAALEAQQFLSSSLQAQGSILASGRTGQSIGLLAEQPGKEYSRDLATLGLSLGYALQDYYGSTQSIYGQAQSDINVAQGNRMLQPMSPILAQATLSSPVLAPDPVKISALKAPGPSPLGLISGIAGGAVSGYSAYSSLKPKPATVPAPNPNPNPYG